MRYLLLTSEPGDVERGSGTAVAVQRLRAALAGADVATPVLRPSTLWPSQTLARRRFNRRLRNREFMDVDALLGINGDGWQTTHGRRIPFIAMIKALFVGALPHERGVTKRVLALHARWEAEGARGAEAVVVPSEFALRAVSSEYGVDSRRIHVVPEPFDAQRWRDALPARQREPQRVLCVAHLYPRKRVLDVVRAWPAVRSAMPRARLDIAGSGPELRRIDHEARGLTGCYLHGHLEGTSLRELHARAGVFCLPSAQETFGYAAVEAMASGLAMVISDAGALPEVCTGVIGAQVPEGDIDALAAALIGCMDGNVQQRAQAVNPQRAGAFAPDVIARRVIDVVDAARDQRRAGGSMSRSSTSSR